MCSDFPRLLLIDSINPTMFVLKRSQLAKQCMKKRSFPNNSVIYLKGQFTRNRAHTSVSTPRSNVLSQPTCGDAAIYNMFNYKPIKSLSAVRAGLIACVSVRTYTPDVFLRAEY